MRFLALLFALPLAANAAVPCSSIAALKPVGPLKVNAAPLLAASVDCRTFVVPADGTYQLWHRVVGLNDSSDSFFVSIDGGPEFIDDACEGWWPCDGTFWTPLYNRTVQGTPDGTKQMPYTLPLKAGHTLTLTFRVREAGTQLIEAGAGTNPPP